METKPTLQIIDVSIPASPSIADSVTLAKEAATSGDLAYVVTRDSLEIIDPVSAAVIGSVEMNTAKVKLKGRAEGTD